MKKTLLALLLTFPITVNSQNLLQQKLEFCEASANLAVKILEARDLGIPRKVLTDKLAGSSTDPALTVLSIRIIDIVYEHPTLTVLPLKLMVEESCIKNFVLEK